MNTLLDDDETMLKESATNFLRAEVPTILVRQAEVSNEKYATALWSKIAELGWCSLCLPEAYGGQNAPLSWLGLVLEEIGYSIAPLPLATSSAAALTLAKYGSSNEKGLLRAVCTGDAILACAIQEVAGVWDVQSINANAREEGDFIILNAEKYFVEAGQNATHILVAVRKANGADVGVVLVDAKIGGIEVRPLVNTAKGDQVVFSFRNVKVPKSQLIGGWHNGHAALHYLMMLSALFTTAQMAGAARRVTEMSAKYSGDRFAFGQPIGSFQSLQHMVADMLIAVDGTELLAREAFWRIQNDLPAELEVSQAKAFANIHCVTTCRSAQQLHGGIGFMREFDLNLWYRRVVTWSLSCGSTYEHRRVVAQCILDNPGHARLDDCHFEQGHAETRAA